MVVVPQEKPQEENLLENIYNEINSSLKIFGITIHEQLSGNFSYLLGGFYKWHFYYFSYG